MKERDLQQEFNKWAIKNNLPETVQFTIEQKQAFKLGRQIHIKKGNEQELIIKPKEEGIAIKFIQSFDTIKNKLEDEDIKQLLEGNTVTKLNSFEGKITNIENNFAVLNNEIYGEEKIPLKELDITEEDIGKTISVERFVSQKETENGEKYNIDVWKQQNTGGKISYSTYQADEFMRIHEVDPSDIVEGIKSINGIELNQKNKIKLLKGLKVDVEDNEELVISPKNKKGFTAKKALLIGFALAGGPLYYVLYKAIKIAQKQNQKTREKELEKLDAVFKNEIKKHPNNKSLQEEYLQQKAFADFINTGDENKIVLTALTESANEKKQLELQVNEENLFEKLKKHFEENPNDLIVLEVKSKEGRTMAEMALTSDNLFMQNKIMFESAINAQNAKLFENRNNSINEISELIEETKIITERKNFIEKLDIDRRSNFKNYLESMKSIALQKARAYPENQKIRNDINILDKNINLINNIDFKRTEVKQHQKASSTGVNDPDLFEDSLREETEEIKEGRTRKHNQHYRSRGI